MHENYIKIHNLIKSYEISSIDMDILIDKLILNSFNFNKGTYNYSFNFPIKFITLLKKEIIKKIDDINFIDNNVSKAFKISTGFYLTTDQAFIHIKFKSKKEDSYLFKFLNKHKKIFDFSVLINKEEILYLYQESFYKDFEEILLLNSKSHIPKELLFSGNEDAKTMYNLIKMYCY